MKPFVLIKVLESMFYFCKNKTLSLSFYDSAQKTTQHSKAVVSQESFNSSLPSVYYTVDVSTSIKRITARQFNKSSGQYEILSVSEDFDFGDLYKIDIREFSIYKYEEKSLFSGGGIFEECTKYIRFDAILFLQILRSLGECACLTIKSRDKYYIVHYISGKVVISDITDYTYTTRVTTLFALNSLYPDYEIVDFVAFSPALQIKRFLQSVERYCASSGLKYIKIE